MWKGWASPMHCSITQHKTNTVKHAAPLPFAPLGHTLHANQPAPTGQSTPPGAKDSKAWHAKEHVSYTVLCTARNRPFAHTMHGMAARVRHATTGTHSESKLTPLLPLLLVSTGIKALAELEAHCMTHTRRVQSSKVQGVRASTEPWSL